MEEAVRSRLIQWENAPISWDPVGGGKRGIVCFEDDKTYDLGSDPDQIIFRELSSRFVTGRYYPPDAVRFHGRFLDEKRSMEAGEIVLQQASLLGKLGLIYVWSMVCLSRIEQKPERCSIGYVTTKRHPARGIWNAELSWKDGRLLLRVKSTASPNSWLFWIGLPVARFLQLRARRRAVQEFRKAASNLRS